MIEKIKNKDNIIKLLFSLIKILIVYQIPEIKEYFADTIKYQPNELDLIIYHINDYDKYLDFFLKKVQELKYNIYHIFIQSCCSNNEETLHKIITILKESKNECSMDCLFLEINSKIIEKF